MMMEAYRIAETELMLLPRVRMSLTMVSSLLIMSVSIDDQLIFGIMGEGNILMQCWQELSLNVSGTMISTGGLPSLDTQSA
jgi:hypothetical protein